MSHDQKVMMLLPLMEKCTMELYQGISLLPKFDNISSSVTRDKEMVR